MVGTASVVRRGQRPLVARPHRRPRRMPAAPARSAPAGHLRQTPQPCGQAAWRRGPRDCGRQRVQPGRRLHRCARHRSQGL